MLIITNDNNKNGLNQWLVVITVLFDKDRNFFCNLSISEIPDVRPVERAMAEGLHIPICSNQNKHIPCTIFHNLNLY